MHNAYNIYTYTSTAHGAYKKTNNHHLWFTNSPKEKGQKQVAHAIIKYLINNPSLWADVSMSAWPSITHPRVHEIISTFPNGHRSFFEDSFPSLFTYRRPSSLLNSQQKECLPSELISLVDTRYKGNIIYSTAHFTNTTTDHFLSSPFQIVLNEESTHVPEKFDDLLLALTNNEATLSLLKESVTLNWIIINPTQKRAGNLSIIKPVSVRNGWMPNEFILQYVTVLPAGCDPNEIVICRIQLVLLVAADIDGDAILQVKEVSLKLQDLFSRCLNGKDFMVTTQRAILEENNVRRTVIDDERRLVTYMQLKQMKRDKKDLVKKEEEKTKFVIKMNYAGLLLSFCFSVYLLSSLVHKF